MEQYHLPEAQIKLLNQLLKDTTELLEQNEIPYWIDGGTLLGAVRHGGQIPWDDDVDLGVMSKDYQDLPRILLPLLDKGYELIIVDSIFKVIQPSSSLKADNRTIGTACLDIFPWASAVTNGVERLQLENEGDLKRWPNCYHEQHDFYPLIDYSFDGLRVKGPSNPLPYLNRMYPGFEKTAVIDLRIPSEDNPANYKNQQGVDWMDQIFEILALERQLFVEELNGRAIKVFWRKNFRAHHGAGSWKLDNKVFYEASVLLADGKQGEKVQYLKEVFEERNDSTGYYVMKLEFDLEHLKYVDKQRISMFDYVLSLSNLLQTRPENELQVCKEYCWF